VHSPTASLQVKAGPGTGKTQVLTARIAYLHHHYGLPLDSICAVTFTKRAQEEMKRRLKSKLLLGTNKANDVMIGTFHSLCLQLLSRHPAAEEVCNLPKEFTVCNAEQRYAVLCFPSNFPIFTMKLQLPLHVLYTQVLHLFPPSLLTAR
jgi:DNA helicase-2/ATP-dependent DNA helicase PcrA